MDSQLCSATYYENGNIKLCKMEQKDSGAPKKGKGQSRRLVIQQELAGGPVGIFGKAAKRHDLSVRNVMKTIFESLQNSSPALSFRHRSEIPKQEINRRLQEIDSNLGKVLFVQNSRIKPDGGIIEVLDNTGKYRIVLVSESKHQGNDVEKIKAGIK